MEWCLEHLIQGSNSTVVSTSCLPATSVEWKGYTTTGAPATCSPLLDSVIGIHASHTSPPLDSCFPLFDSVSQTCLIHCPDLVKLHQSMGYRVTVTLFHLKVYQLNWANHLH
eukprot:Gb_00962 [translate_table: standard]